jgi:hypothetical protein
MSDRSAAGVLRAEGAFRVGRLSPTDLVVWTIVVSAAIRLVMGQLVGYGNGEGYYLASARHLAFSYFDQPPLFLWIAHAAIAVFGTSSSLLPRLPFIAIFAGTTWLMYRLGARLFGEAAGAWAAFLLNLSTLFTVSVGSWVQPDAVLFFFLTAAALPIVELAFGQPERPLRQWALAGACFGLAMLSKYHAALILAGLVIFVATTPGYRTWFLKPGVILAGVIATAVFAPVMIWNAEHQWVSFTFQGGRIVRSSGLRFDWLGRDILGQALLIGPLIWPALMLFYFKALKVGPRDPKSWLLSCLAITPIIVFTLASLWAPLGWHFHWQGPGYLYLFPLLGKAVADDMERGNRGTRTWLAASTGVLVLVVGLLGTQAASGWMHRYLAPFNPSKPYNTTNPTREVLEWRPLRAALDQRGLLNQSNLFVVAGKWFEAGHADVVVGDRLPVVCLSRDPRNIAYAWDDRRFTHWDALIVVPSNSHQDPVADYQGYFRSITPLPDVEVPLGGQTALTLHLWRAHDYYRPYPLPYGLSRKTVAGQTSDAGQEP